MGEELTLVEKRESTGRSRGRGSAAESLGLGSLAPQIHEAAYRRLAWLAILYSATYFAAFASDFILHARWHWRDQTDGDLILPALSILAGLGFAFLVHSRRIPSHTLPIWALVFEVIGAIGIGWNAWGWEDVVTRRPELLGISWMSVWILIFPAAIAVPPGRALVAGLIAASVGPFFMWLSPHVHGIQSGVDPQLLTQVTISFNMPSYICAGLASAVSAVIYGLSRDVTRARQMGSYHLVERIGAGGMGEVWKARHRLLVRPAAIKLIRAEALGTGPETRASAVQRFEREAQATALLRSPHTVELYDFGVTEDGTLYYVMELLEGLDLKTLVERFGPMPGERVVHLLQQVCHSLADAHASGMIHRDIKPANVVVGQRGPDADFVKVLDFGLVTSLRAIRAEPQLTQQGLAPGTPAFMAPELAMSGTSTDPLVDVYALGCVAYWLVCGRLVFEGPTPTAILVQHAKDPPPPPSTRTEVPVHPALEELILRCLRKDPQERPASARELSRLLAACAGLLPAWTEERAIEWWRIHSPHPAPTEGLPVAAASV